LIGIDMLRGIAAMGVVICHATQAVRVMNGGAANFGQLKTFILLPAMYGFSGVYLFFVISGFCIHLRWARARAQGRSDASIDFIPFWKRRIRRLYPAYLAALVLFLSFGYYRGTLKVTAFLSWDIILHLLMLHNVTPKTLYSINGVFWTLAIEEQLYLAYFLLVWLRTRFGWSVTLLTCVAARVFWFGLRSIAYRQLKWDFVFTGSAAANWWIWALGAISVEAMMGVIVLPSWCRSRRVLVAALTAAAVLVYLDFFVLWFYDSKLHGLALLLGQPLWGLGFFILVNIVSWHEPRWQALKDTWIIAALSILGLISYSLYLTHEIVVMPMRHRAILSTVLSIPTAWVFFQLFERPFLSQPVQNAASELSVAQPLRIEQA